MENADMREVYKRLAKTSKPLLDERMREFPFPGGDDSKEEATQCNPVDSSSVVEST